MCVDVEGGGGAGVTVTVGSEGGESMTSSLNGEVNLYIEVSEGVVSVSSASPIYG